MVLLIRVITYFTLLSLLFINVNILPREKQDTVYVIRRNWHTAIIIPRNQLSKQLYFIIDDLGEQPYYEFGWGDKEYYQNDKTDNLTGIKALLLPTAAVMHVRRVKTDPQLIQSSSKIVVLSLSRTMSQDLQNYIQKSFLLSNERAIISKKASKNSIYYESSISYHALYTCNTWTLDMFKKTGVDVSPHCSIYAENALQQLRDAQNKK